MLKGIHIEGEADAEGGAGGERRAIVVRLRLVVEEVVDGGGEADAAPEVVLEHEAPDGVALIDVGTARLGLALAAAGESGVEGVMAREAVIVAQAPGHGVRAGLVEVRVIDVARLLHPRIVEPQRQTAVPYMAQTDIHAPDRDAVLVGIECTLHAVDFRTGDGSDALVEDVAVAHEGEIVAPVEEAAVADAVRAFDGEIEVVALLRLEVGVSDDHIAHVAHVEVHIHLLERGGAEAAGIVGAEGHPWRLIDDGEALRECLL